MALDPRLLEILACPDDKGPLFYFAPGTGGVPADAGGLLLCPACRRRYDVRDDIPVMLIDEATVLPQAEVDALLERARAEGITPTFSEGTPRAPGSP
ncbi:MAG: Trm112 family protein [Acidimicrobiia bacterium]